MHPLGGEAFEHVGEVGALEARLAGDLGLELFEALGRCRIAVDADQTPGRTDSVGDQLRVTAAAEGASTTNSPGWGSASATSSGARTGRCSVGI